MLRAIKEGYTIKNKIARRGWVWRILRKMHIQIP